MKIKPIETRFSDSGQSEEILNNIYSHMSTVEEVYMEIGMQCGAILVMQLINGIMIK